MNRREALTAMGAAGLCPTAAMAIPEKKEQENPNNLPVVEFDEKGEIIVSGKLLNALKKSLEFKPYEMSFLKKAVLVWMEKKNAFVPSYGGPYKFWGECYFYYVPSNGKYYLITTDASEKKTNQ